MGQDIANPSLRFRPASRVDWLPMLSLIAGVIVWEGAGRLLDFKFFPPFSRVLSASLAMIANGEIVTNLAASLSSLFIGFTLAAAGGVLLGALMGRYPLIEHSFDIYIHAFLAAPTLVYVPILFALFGVSRLSQIAVVFLYAFFIITVNSMAGIHKVNRDWIEMARSFGATERQLFWRVMLPASLPLILSGLRTGLARATKGMINGEMYIALIGLGALIRRYGARFDAEHVLGVLLILILVTLVLMSLFALIERRLLKWVDGWQLFGATDDAG
jgi:NitT/TauT family transport system permease protein